MRTLIATTLTLGLIAGAVLMSQAGPPGDAARAAALKLYKSLSEEQKKLAVKPVNDKERHSEQFPAVERPGLPYSKLTAEQKAMAEAVVKAITSEYGASRCLEVAKQTPEDRRYVNFFGEPSADKPFAWRVAAHHLTLIYAEFGDAKANEFGPVLLGGNPAKTLWDEEEKLAIAFYAALPPEEAKKVQAKGANATSGAAIGKAGVRIGDLDEKARDLARKLLEKRLAVFNPERRQVVDKIIKDQGGADNLRIAVWNEITKSHLDGGNYHWRIGNDTIVCDWQTVGKNHIHMTLRARPKG